jgi:hypothetical protein
MRRRRIWSETVPYPTVTSPRTLALLKRYDLGVLLAVRPDTVDGLAAALERLAGEGVPTSVWPMLDDADGRWANAKNHTTFARFARRVADAADATRGAWASEIVVDLEPAIDDVRAALGSVRAAGRLLESVADGTRLAGARDAFATLAREMLDRGVTTTAVAVPMVLLDRDASARWQGLLGTPLDGPSWSNVNVMLYTSILEGWSRGLFDRRGATTVLAAACRATAERFGPRGSVSLGAVGVGAFGDEPTYRSPPELARDVGIARAAGVDDLTLFDLGGVLSRGPSEAWLDAFVETGPDPLPPPESLRGRAAMSFASLTGASLEWIAPLLRRKG